MDVRHTSPPNVLDLAGNRFGMLVTIERAGKTKNDNALWLCLCDCGNTAIANATSMRKGDTYPGLHWVVFRHPAEAEDWLASLRSTPANVGCP